MKQLPGEIRDRLARKPAGQNLLSKSDIAEAAEAQAADENGRQGTPNYFASAGEDQSEPPESEDTSQQDGKGMQIDLEA